MADDFFVGYGERAPDADRRFLRTLVPLLLVLGLAVAGTLASQSRDPGAGTWAWDEERSWEGVLRIDPYPRLVLDDGRTALVVAVGKLAIGTRAEGLADRRVRLSGTWLERDGELMIELADGDGALDAVGGPVHPAAPLPDPVILELVGEILDSKCHLGAMKPGDGKTHKACATLCLDGGIPPVLGTWDADGRASYWLLTDADGGPANALVRDVVGEPVRIRGRQLVRDGQGLVQVLAVQRLADG